MKIIDSRLNTFKNLNVYRLTVASILEYENVLNFNIQIMHVF